MDLLYLTKKQRKTLVTTNQVAQFYMWKAVKEGQGAVCVTLTHLGRNLKPEERRFLMMSSSIFPTKYLVMKKI